MNTLPLHNRIYKCILRLCFKVLSVPSHTHTSHVHLLSVISDCALTKVSPHTCSTSPTPSSRAFSPPTTMPEVITNLPSVSILWTVTRQAALMTSTCSVCALLLYLSTWPVRLEPAPLPRILTLHRYAGYMLCCMHACCNQADHECIHVSAREFYSKFIVIFEQRG